MGIKTAGTVLHVSSTMDLMRWVPGNICNFYEFCVIFAFITLIDLMNLLKEGIIFFFKFLGMRSCILKKVLFRMRYRLVIHKMLNYDAWIQKKKNSLSDVLRMEITTNLFQPSTMEIWTILCPVHRVIISAITMSCVRNVPETSFWKPSSWQHLYLWMRLDSKLYGFSCPNSGPLILVVWIENL